MKKLIFLFILLSVTVCNAQKIGSTLTPFSTFGWDTPAQYTTYYQLPVYRLLSNPGGWINKNQAKVDSLLHALVVYTDTTQMYVENDTLKLKHAADGGRAQFTGTGTSVTISIPDLKGTDLIVATPIGTGITANDILTIQYATTSIAVRRLSGGTADLQFNWIRIKQ